MGRVSGKDLKARWTDYCVKHKLNTTQQREAIVDLFLRSHDHVSIDEVLVRVRKKHPKVGYATVYRTLKLLEECGVALSRHFDDGQTRYEVAGAHHDHLICVKCNMILEFENEEIERLQDEMAMKLGGFRVLRHKHELYCICPKEAGVPGGNCPHDKAAAARN